MPLLKLIYPNEVPTLRRNPVDRETLLKAGDIVDDVRRRGDHGLREYSERFGDLEAGAALVLGRDEMKGAWESLPEKTRQLLERTAGRIRTFADSQRRALGEVTAPIPGGQAGHLIAPVERAGCYAPGGRFPLPSSVLMTVIAARAAGVETVWAASPKPAPVTLGAAWIAGADALLAAGGAQAIAALAYGTESVLACDAVVGPGNRWVTAAKQLVAGQVQIDMLAGPSELVIVADDSADPGVVAADLLAQAEHDPDALPILISLDSDLPDKIERELALQLQDLPTRETARAALENGYIVAASSIDEAVELCNSLAPEHLQLLVTEPDSLTGRLKHFGGLFIGQATAEVLGDYGAGPNHTLPTGGTARSTAGLSVFTFLRIQTWLRIDNPVAAQEIVRDAVELARQEGLEAHARAAEKRLK